MKYSILLNRFGKWRQYKVLEKLHVFLLTFQKGIDNKAFDNKDEKVGWNIILTTLQESHFWQSKKN